MEDLKIEIEGDQGLIEALVKVMAQLNQENNFSFDWLVDTSKTPGLKVLSIKGSDPMHFYSLGLKHARIMMLFAQRVSSRGNLRIQIKMLR